MSAFIKLNKQDAFVVPYTAHKSFAFTSIADSGSTGVETYYGSRNRGTIFNQAETTFNNEYPRLVYDSINHLYFSNFTSSLQSGSFENYNQTTLHYTRSLLSTDGQDIFVVGVRRDRFGEAIKPGTFKFRTGSAIIIDDAEGNLFPESDIIWNTTVYTYASESATVADIPTDTTITFTAGVTIPSGYTFVTASWTGTPAKSPFLTYVGDNSVQTVSNDGLTLDDSTGTLTTTGDPTYFINGGNGETMDLIFVSSSLQPVLVGQSQKVGNIFYPHGIAVVTDTAELVDLLRSSKQSESTLNWQATHTVFQHEYRCRVNESQLNYSQNPSIKSGSNGYVYDFATGSYFQPYITTIGLYNDANELVAVGKLSQPVPKSRYTDMTFVVKFDS